MLWGKYEPETYSFFKKIIKPGMIIVDIGAHIGYFTRLFSRLAGRDGFVYALEADPENFSLLKKNTLHLKNAMLLPLAVSNQTGSINFYRSEKTGCHSTIEDRAQHKETITVASSDLDSILSNRQTEKVDVIKIDIEGGELNALKGMQKTLSTNRGLSLVIEFNPGCLKQAAVAPREFIRYISGLGFYIYAIHQDALILITAAEMEPEKYLLRGATFVNLYCTKTPN
jgi:FkbM family methyltransferase